MRIPTGVSAGLSLTLVSCGYLLIVGPGSVAGAISTAGQGPGQSTDQNALRAANPPTDWPTAPPMRSSEGIPVTTATGPAVQPMNMPAPPDMTIGLDQNGDTISLALGQTLVVSLDGNATTGYVWERGRVKKKVLSTDGDVTYTPTSAPTSLATPQPGSGGVFTARITAVGLGQGYVKLVYDRPFEADAPPIKTFTVLVLVTPQSIATPSLAPTTPPMTTSMQ